MGPFGHKTNLNKVPNNPNVFFAYTELDYKLITERYHEDYQIIRKELETFSKKLLNKQEIIIANKMDIPLTPPVANPLGALKK